MSATAPETALYECRLTGLRRVSQGKVRDIYEVDDETPAHRHDRPAVRVRRGAARSHSRQGRGPDPALELLVRTHAADRRESPYGSPAGRRGHRSRRDAPPCARRAVVVRRLKPLPVEAVVRGYLIGSGWKDYKVTGAVCGIPLPAGLAMAAQLPQPIFTPATKAEIGRARREHQFRRNGAAGRRGAGGRASDHSPSRSTRAAPNTRAGAGSSSRTPSSNSVSTRRVSST